MTSKRSNCWMASKAGDPCMVRSRSRPRKWLSSTGFSSKHCESKDDADVSSRGFALHKDRGGCFGKPVIAPSLFRRGHPTKNLGMHTCCTVGMVLFLLLFAA